MSKSAGLSRRQLIELQILRTLVLLSALLGVASCAGRIPYWGGKIWAGDHERQSIRRAQDNEEISCSQVEFSNYFCMSREDLNSFYRTYVLGCKRWKGVGTNAEMRMMLMTNGEFMP